MRSADLPRWSSRTDCPHKACYPLRYRKTFLIAGPSAEQRASSTNEKGSSWERRCFRQGEQLNVDRRRTQVGTRNLGPERQSQQMERYPGLRTMLARFRQSPFLIGVVHLQPLPGAPRYAG